MRPVLGLWKGHPSRAVLSLSCKAFTGTSRFAFCTRLSTSVKIIPGEPILLNHEGPIKPLGMGCRWSLLKMVC
jgi:hypothetical protein